MTILDRYPLNESTNHQIQRHELFSDTTLGLIRAKHKLSTLYNFKYSNTIKFTKIFYFYIFFLQIRWRNIKTIPILHSKKCHIFWFACTIIFNNIATKICELNFIFLKNIYIKWLINAKIEFLVRNSYSARSHI